MAAEHQHSPFAVTVCIATRNRPAGLERLLSSLLSQRNAPAFDVLVVDNDPGGSARGLVERYADRLTITYAVEIRPGVSSVRNRCVSQSRAPLLAFIDDDEWAEPDWLAVLCEKMADSSVAAAVGTRTFVFAEDVPLHRRTCALFVVPALEDGQPLAWNQTMIANACLRRAALPDATHPFDPALNMIGGEDSHLFAEIIGKGGRVIAASGAVTREYRSAQRTTLRDLLGRAYRHGATGVEIDWEGKPGWRRLSFAIGSVVRFLGNACFAVSTWLTRREYSFQRAVIAAGWAGRAGRIVGWRFQEYRQVRN